MSKPLRENCGLGQWIESASYQSRALHLLDARSEILAALEALRKETPTKEEILYAEMRLNSGLRALDLSLAPRAGENGVVSLETIRAMEGR